MQQQGRTLTASESCEFGNIMNDERFPGICGSKDYWTKTCKANMHGYKGASVSVVGEELLCKRKCTNQEGLVAVPVTKDSTNIVQQCGIIIYNKQNSGWQIVFLSLTEGARISEDACEPLHSINFT